MNTWCWDFYLWIFTCSLIGCFFPNWTKWNIRWHLQRCPPKYVSWFMFTKSTLFVQREAPKISKLVQITPMTMVYGTYNELVTGAYLNQQTSLGGLTLYIYIYRCPLYIQNSCCNDFNQQIHGTSCFYLETSQTNKHTHTHWWNLKHIFNKHWWNWMIFRASNIIKPALSMIFPD